MQGTFRDWTQSNALIPSCWHLSIRWPHGPEQQVDGSKLSRGKEYLFLSFSLQKENVQVPWKLLFRGSGPSLSKFLTFYPFGGVEANIGFCTCSANGNAFFLYWQSCENQFLSKKITLAIAISSCHVSSEWEGAVVAFHWSCWLF